MLTNTLMTLCAALVLVLVAGGSGPTRFAHTNESLVVRIVRALNLLFIFTYIVIRLPFAFENLKIFICFSFILVLIIRGVFALRFKLFWDFLQLFVPTFIVVSLVSIIAFDFNKLVFRFHTNPDTYGYAAGTGFFLQSFSWQEMVSEFQAKSGWLSFETPSAAPLVSTPWAITDQQIRYSGDTVLSAGRAGFPILFSLILRLFKDYSFFYVLWMIAGVVLTVLLSLLFWEIVIKVRRTPDLINTETKSLRFFRPIPFLLILAFASQPWLNLMVLEGQPPQIWTLIGVLFLMERLLSLSALQGMSAKAMPGNRKRARIAIFDIIILLCATYVVYPQSLLLLSMLFVPTLCLLAYSKKLDFFRYSKRLVLYALGFWLTLTYFSLDKLTLKIVDQIANSGVGGGIHIGIVNLFEIIGLQFVSNRLQISPPSFLAIVEPALLSGLSVLFVASSIIVLHQKFLEKSTSLQILFLPTITSATLAQGYLLLPLIGLSPVTIDYVWFRYITLFGLLAVTFMTYATAELLEPLIASSSSAKKLFFGFIAIASPLYTINSPYLVGRDFDLHTVVSKPPSCPSTSDMGRTLFYSDGYFYSSAAYTVCGPFSFLTDPGASIFRETEKKSKLAYIEPSSLRISRERTFESQGDIVPPCDVKCTEDLYGK